MSKYYLLLSLFLLLNLVGCSKSNKEEYNSSISTKITKFSRNQQWKEEGWYKAKDGDWFNNFLGWYRHVAYIESDNDMPQYFSFGTPMYPYFNLAGRVGLEPTIVRDHPLYHLPFWRMLYHFAYLSI